MEEHFRVALGTEKIPFAFQLLPKLPVVIDFSIEDDVEIPVGSGHGLRAGFRYIYDRQASVRQPDALVLGDPQSCTIRAAFDHRFTDPEQLFPVNGRCVFAIREYGDDSAHRLRWLLGWEGVIQGRQLSSG